MLNKEIAMNSLVDAARRIYLDATDDDCVVKPSIPILFFGDSDRYFGSSLKVITVALNPSRKEFPDHDRFARFRSASSVNPDHLDRDARASYLTALNDYFRNVPYTAWFGWFEQVLLGLGTSYYSSQSNTAVHTDLCSPLATDPTWSLLGSRQERYESEGMALWHQLVTLLSPDVIVISVARKYRDRIDFANPEAWGSFVSLPRSIETKRPYVAWSQEATLPNGAVTHLLFGQAAQQPFATLDKESRRQIGIAFREQRDGR